MEDVKMDEEIFLWLQSSSQTENQTDIKLLVEHVQQIICNVRVYDDPDECVDVISSLPNEIFFVGLDRGRSYLVSILETIHQVHFIYLSEPYEKYTSSSKVRGVMRQLRELLHQLERDVRISEQRHTHLNTCEVDMLKSETATQDLQKHMARFMWSQTLLELLIHMPSSVKENGKELIDELKRLYQRNPLKMKEVDEFERTYVAANAITWYTKASFLYKVINKGLRTQNIIIIYKFRSLLQDIHKQLKELQQKQQPFDKTQVLYRGQKIAPDELALLQTNIGGLISTTTFMSTSTNLKVAMLFSNLEQKDSFFDSVIFEYYIDPDLQFSGLPPFANVSSLSAIPDEDEVLLSMGTIARIESIVPDEVFGHIHRVRLHLCELPDSSWKQYKAFLSKQLNTINLKESDYIFQLTHLLCLMGEYERAEQLTNLFSQRNDNKLHPCQSLLVSFARFSQLGVLFDNIDSWGPSEIGKLFDQVQAIANDPSMPQNYRALCSMANNIMAAIKSPWDRNDSNEDDSSTQQNLNQGIENIERLYSSINTIVPSLPGRARFEHALGILHSYQKDHTKAIEHYNRALVLSDTELEQSHPSRPLLSHGLASSVEHISNDDEAAQILHRSLLDTNQNATHVATFKKLANYHEKREDWPAAIACYRDIISLPYLPPNSIEIICAYCEIGDAFFSMVKISEAMENYRRALDLLQQHHPEDHQLLKDIHLRIDFVQKFST